ncbi:LysR family transcriptional regulator [Siminovitchia acidinfaciens]|uniref:LysR family transcriptional regulator n=1 Tax=Siminovitchia acidinfaciens TaxID=2321395 RepID=A0A429XWN4_9BACI|nr:LysR family transcriptional regulator [Siminovitchia acidinfaciens]RST72802.1 LysR family transcriptional regulator [Siminovitchia acidinfaciens]VEF49428.1 LysR family transcriptional regulator [Bacillus freudenreichii]
MNLQQMEYVKTIAETKSMNKASEVLHVSQPALTKQLKILEDELKTILFERDNSGCHLTKEGELFLVEAKKILNQVHSLKQQFVQRENKVINIGTLPSIAAHFLPGIVKKLNNSGHKINIHIAETSEQIKNLLFDGKIDVGFGQDVKKRDYVYSILIEPYYLIVPEAHPLGEAKSISLSDITNQNMIVPTLPCDIRISLDKYLKHQGIVMENMMEVGQNDSMLSLVKNGVGLTILPKMAVNAIDKSVKAIPIKSGEFNRKISLLTHSKELHDLIIGQI